MRLKDFVKSIDAKTPETIIKQVSLKEIKEHPDKAISFNAKAWLVLEDAKLEGVGIYNNNLMLLFSKDGEVFGLDWCDGFGATLCEYIPSEPIIYGGNVIQELKYKD